MMRKLLGFAFFVGGGFLVAFSFGRYLVGVFRADDARQAWESAEAKSSVAMARAVALRNRHPVEIVAGAPMARLSIPKIGLDEIVLEGVGSDELNAEPGHLPGSALPGERGNAVISAHRDRHFSHLDDVIVGDTINTESGIQRATWVVVSKRVVDKNSRALVRTSDATLTLTTCWPIRFMGPAPERLIITAKRLDRAAVQVAATN